MYILNFGLFEQWLILLIFYGKIMLRLRNDKAVILRLKKILAVYKPRLPGFPSTGIPESDRTCMDYEDHRTALFVQAETGNVNARDSYDSLFAHDSVF